MKLKNNGVLYVLLIIGVVLLGYLTWLLIRSVEIKAVHHRSSSSSDVLVNNFPLTDKGKIAWWLKNKNMLRDEYNVPEPEPDGSFHLDFWQFGEGYKERGKYDRLCFNDMKTEVNCIEKDIVFSVHNSRNMGMMFKAYDGTYRLQKNGEIVKYVDRY